MTVNDMRSGFIDLLSDPNYDWIVVGGGISGISVAEILCREKISTSYREK